MIKADIMQSSYLLISFVRKAYVIVSLLKITVTIDGVTNTKLQPQDPELIYRANVGTLVVGSL